MDWNITYAEGKGRALVADHAYRPGHVILEQEPYEAVLYDDQTSTRSHLTFKECDRSLRCGGCKQAWCVPADARIVKCMHAKTVKKACSK